MPPVGGPCPLAIPASLMLVDVLKEAGLPDGVLNVVTSESARRVVTPWMESGIARKVTFTGSTEVGIGLLKQAADNVMKSSMELGGNAPFVVLEDADLDKAVRPGDVHHRIRRHFVLRALPLPRPRARLRKHARHRWVSAAFFSAHRSVSMTASR